MFMSISSILFRGESGDYDLDATQPEVTEAERPTRSLRRMLKPWPFSSAPRPTRAVADDDEDDDEDYRAPTSAVVLDRLSQFAKRR
jgi:hypothetical protein